VDLYKEQKQKRVLGVARNKNVTLRENFPFNCFRPRQLSWTSFSLSSVSLFDVIL